MEHHWIPVDPTKARAAQNQASLMPSMHIGNCARLPSFDRVTSGITSAGNRARMGASGSRRARSNAARQPAPRAGVRCGAAAGVGGGGASLGNSGSPWGPEGPIIVYVFPLP
eukprot:gene8376-biopygen9429